MPKADDGPQRLALITGASSGIGERTAERLVSRGYRVIAAARRLERLQAMADRLGAACLPVQLDVTRDESVASLTDRLPEPWRGIDILINNAGHDTGGRAPFDEGSLADWLSIVETNVGGMLRVTRALLPAMLARGSGHIVNMGSLAGIQPIDGEAAYVASKHAVHGFSRALLMEYRGRLRVTEILAGAVRTEFNQVRRGYGEAESQAFYDSFPQCLAADDIAQAILFALEQPERANVAEMLIMPSA